MLTKIKWLGKRKFEGETESGHKVKMDIAIEKGGENTGPTPMELVLTALGACTGLDVVPILEKKRVKLDGLEIKLEAERADTYPRVFKKIKIEYIFQGNDLKEADLKNAVELSADKYCSVSSMIKKTSELEYSWKIK
ncbi:MAG TPA: OsmC family protein [Terriglobales bacterium]|nr:OsmC family protein [Terriglobales bacterium]